MQTASKTLAALTLFACTATIADARSTFATPDNGGGSGGVLQCVPYARQVSGIHIYGDAHSWWGKANGKYARGSMPRVGAVMGFVRRAVTSASAGSAFFGFIIAR